MRLDTGGGGGGVGGGGGGDCGVGGGDYGWSFLAPEDAISFSVDRWSLVPGG